MDKALPRRRLGTDSASLSVSCLGLGCMGMSEFYSGRDERQALETLDRALELGIDLLDTADIYGQGANETLLGRFLDRSRRSRITLATKFGIVRQGERRGFNGRPDYVRSSCEASLRRLRTDVIDLYYLHRVDPDTPIEETVGAMARLVEEGKVRRLGLSEVAASTLRRAHRVHPICAVQSEFSLWTRDPEEEVLPACRELGVGFVSYAPLGRGFLTGAFAERGAVKALDADDTRRKMPRFQDDNWATNVTIVRRLSELAAQCDCSRSQLALAWVLASGDDIVPVFGTQRIAHLEENLGAARVRLSRELLDAINRLIPADAVAGDRYGKEGMKSLTR